MNKELITKIASGTPLHNDIDNVELLRKVLREAFPKDTLLKPEEIWGDEIYYYKYGNNGNFWYCGNYNPYPEIEPIKLSEFLEEKPMIEIDEVMKWVDELKPVSIDVSILGVDFCHGFMEALNQLKEFLNNKKNTR